LRLDQKIQNDDLKSVRNDYWAYQDRYGPNGEKAPDPFTKTRMQNLKQQLDDQQKKVDDMRLKGTIK
jgi:hypothetical protein